MHGRYVGKPVKRREDPRLVTGRGKYVADITLPRMLYLSIVRSPYAHAKIKNIDTSKAERLEGVRHVFTGEHVRDCTPLPGEFRLTVKDSIIPSYKPLAVDKARYAGEGVAAVLADNPYVARDAADLVEVDYKPLEPLTDPLKALEEGSIILHEEYGSNVSFELEYGSWDDAEQGFSEAEVVVKGRFAIPRVAAVPLEGRGVVADYNPAEGVLTAYVSTQLPHRERFRISRTLGLPENRVRVIAPDVGGGFGAKLNYYPEHYLACLLAYRLGRPVKWISDRREDFLSNGHGRDVVGEVELAADRSGRVKGLRARLVANLGAYVIDTTQRYPVNAASMLSGGYDIKRAYVKLYGVFTNTPPSSAYRGAGRPEAMVFIEYMMDKLARAVGKDPSEVRMLNMIKPEQMPYTNFSGTTYDNGDFPKAFQKALEEISYWNVREEQRKAQREGRYLGVAITLYVERNSFGWESATVRVEPTGKVAVYTGSSPHGQGEETSFAQIVADELGVDIDEVTIIHGDTLAIPMGWGTGGSRSLTVGGSAIILACREIKEKARRIAAHLLEANTEDIVYEDGRVYVRDMPERGLTLKEIAEKAYSGAVPMEEMGMQVTRYWNNSGFFTSYGAHGVVVEIDPETWVVKILKAVLVDDCGRVVNPLLVEGQVVGGAAQAVGEVLYEEIPYSEDGQPLVTTLSDYPVPTALEIPNFATYTIETQSNSPLGSKGVGESGTIGFLPALINAIQDALAVKGVELSRIPATPSYLFKLIKDIP